jgi:serine/threonine protein kinase
MGNKGSLRKLPLGDDRLFVKQYGVVKVYRTNNSTEQEAYVKEIECDSGDELQSVKRHWEGIKNTIGKFIVPFKVEVDIDRGLFDTKKCLVIWFPIQEYTLSQFASQNNQLNSLIPEIQILNIFSNVIDGLLLLEEKQIPHGNVSPDTIVNDGDEWILSTPCIGFSSLKERATLRNEDIKFLIAPELLITDKSLNVDQFKADLYSLAVSLMHTLDKFPAKSHSASISQAHLKSKIGFLEEYYSKALVEIFTSLLASEPNERLSCREVRDKLDIMIDG